MGATEMGGALQTSSASADRATLGVMRKRVIAAVTLVALALPAGASADYPHVVTPGESLTSIAATDGLSITALAQANGLSPTAQLLIGQIVQIPPQQSPVAGTSNAAVTTPVVQTTSSVARQQPPEAGDGDGDADDPAPQPTQTRQTTTSSAPATSSSPAPAQPPAPSQSQPTSPVRVSGALIAQIASRYGVPAPFAEAIAWQESGWNNAVVSSAGARGVMQIIPGTWSWINTFLTPSAPLQPNSAADNVRAGVLLLHSLLLATGGSETQAAAAYYQGLTSVQSFGMFPGTRQYVADVLALTHRFGG